MRLQIHVIARRIPRAGLLGNKVDVLLAVRERDKQVRPAQAGREGWTNSASPAASGARCKVF